MDTNTVNIIDIESNKTDNGKKSRVGKAQAKSIDSYFNSLDSVETKIASICLSKGVAPDNLENQLDKFSEEDEDALLRLLHEKLSLQELIFKMQGGSLDNIVFLASHQLELVKSKEVNQINGGV